VFPAGASPYGGPVLPFHTFMDFRVLPWLGPGRVDAGVAWMEPFLWGVGRGAFTQVSSVRLAALAFIALMVAGVFALVPASAARSPGIVIAVDLSHGQPASGIEVMIDMVPEAEWILILSSQDALATVPETVLAKVTEVRYGGLTPDTLDGVDVLIIGQPTLILAPEEVDAVTAWFQQEGYIRVLWVAGDSDYPAQGSEVAQQAMNQVLEAIGSKIRADYVSVEDEESFAGRTYRVIGLVNPSPEVACLGCGAEKALFHGPGPLYAINDNGEPVNPVETPVPGVYVVVTTSEKGKIVQHQAAPDGLDPEFYTNIGEYGVFPLLLVEDMTGDDGVPKRVIASGETPYGGYQAGITWEYYGIPTQGPKLFQNLIYWATGYMGPLMECSKLIDTTGKVGQLEQQVQDLKATVDQLSTKLDQIAQQQQAQPAETAQQAPETTTAQQSNTALYVGVLALIVALAAVGLAIRK